MLSVLMAVYKNDHPLHLVAALDSIRLQKTQPTEIVLVRDGFVSDDIEDVVQFYIKALPIKYYKLQSNQGLPAALNYGLQHVTQPWIARFDADDLNLSDRFELQVEVINDGGIDLFGGQVSEFDSDPERVIGYRRVPIKNNQIKNEIKYRNPFNHMTVCMRSEIVKAVGGYPDVRYMQDYCLWVNMISYGAFCLNLDRVLVNVRVDGLKMYKRRFNYEVVKNEIELRRLMIQRGIGSGFLNVGVGLIRLLALSSPVLIRKLIYQNILRRRY